MRDPGIELRTSCTAFIDLKRSLRQGCALSEAMPLYVKVLIAETMAINIRANPNIQGLRPPGSKAEMKLSQFADDTTLLLTDDPRPVASRKF